jgi:hypothetical protein
MPAQLERFPGTLGKVHKKQVPPDVDIFNEGSSIFDAMLSREFLTYRAIGWDAAIGEINRVAVIDYRDGPVKKTRIVKVPRDSERDRRLGKAEVGILKMLAKTQPPPPFIVPRVERVEENPFYFVLTPVPGIVVNSSHELSISEKRAIGSQTAKIAMWEENISVNTFKERIDQTFGKRWDWHTFFSYLDLDDPDFPSLSTAARDMRALRDRFYPANRTSDQDTQVIHGDLRFPNITLTDEEGQRVIKGVFDWGAARLGTRAEECRSLYPLGVEAIRAANGEFVAEGRPPVDPEEVRFWHIGRYIVALVVHLYNGLPLPEEYLKIVQTVKAEFPDLDWSELPKIKVPSSYLNTGVPPFRPNLNGALD